MFKYVSNRLVTPRYHQTSKRFDVVSRYETLRHQYNLLAVLAPSSSRSFQGNKAPSEGLLVTNRWLAAQPLTISLYGASPDEKCSSQAKLASASIYCRERRPGSSAFISTSPLDLRRFAREPRGAFRKRCRATKGTPAAAKIRFVAKPTWSLPGCCWSVVSSNGEHEALCSTVGVVHARKLVAACSRRYS